ncbi:MAG: hypothetical protein B7Y26_13580 [Hydrogenophilales bacterium 16-64-46]|nr:MAG: hypothetical protein B7Z32_13410 [Hydrogenophilales bacterium 12-64-13]OYZ04038.1 MAG: hypothetical protein B7Y26_13580 [Hydrogenophilales bacterium 16-64-46]OZA36676.1 MAG: hypothetical protein B7X87_13730 [Hydrogenophilales bacterium 17-64-34]HQT01126.1 DUF2141 domain-containing protein [Thiobacillus sp.]
MFNACHFALPLMLCLPSAGAATLTVSIDGVQPAAGPLVVLVFDRAEGFPKEARASSRHLLQTGQTTLALDNLKPGPVAVLAYHDENANGELDRFLGMIPKEGWGLSNNPTVTGKPAFKDAAIALPEAGTRTTIKLKY